MSNAVVTLTGFVAMEPKLTFTRQTNTAVVNLRVGTTPRRVDRTGQWIDGPSSFFTVTCWRKLALNAHASLRKGEPVIIQGRLRTRSWNDNGKVRTTIEVEADSIGHNIAYGWSDYMKGVAPRYQQYLDGAGAEAVPGQPAGNDGFPADGDSFTGGADVSFSGGEYGGEQAPLADEPEVATEGPEGVPDGELAADGVPF